MFEIDIKKKKKLENDVYKMVKGNVSISKMQEMINLSIYEDVSPTCYYFYPSFVKLQDGQIFGMAVHRCKFMSNEDIVVDTIYFTEPFREISKKLYSNEFGFRGYRDVFKAVVNKAGVADIREAAYMLAYYSVPGAGFVDGHYSKPKVHKVFSALPNAYVLLSQHEWGSITVSEKNNGKMKIYQFDGKKCTVVKEPNYIELCEQYEIRPHFMWEAYEKDHPKFRASKTEWEGTGPHFMWEAHGKDHPRFRVSKTEWEGTGLPYIPIVEKCGNKNVLFTHKRDLNKLRECKMVTWTKTLSDIDEVYAYSNKSWEKVDMEKYAKNEAPLVDAEQHEHPEATLEKNEENVEK